MSASSVQTQALAGSSLASSQATHAQAPALGPTSKPSSRARRRAVLQASASSTVRVSSIPRTGSAESPAIRVVGLVAR